MWSINQPDSRADDVENAWAMCTVGGHRPQRALVLIMYESGSDRRSPRGLEVAVLCSGYFLTAVFLTDLNVVASPLVAVLAGPLIWLSAVDLRCREIPDGATLIVAGIGFGLSSGGVYVVATSALVGVTVALSLAGIGHFAWSRTGREWLGLGDAKLIGAGAIVVGIEHLWVMLLLACCGGIGVALLGRSKEDEREIPFGPFLAYAIFVTHLSIGPVE